MMHRRRSRSPRYRSPIRNRVDRIEKSFSISSLSDCSIGNASGNGNRRSEKSRDRHKRHSRNFEKQFDGRDKREKKNSRDRLIDNFQKFDQNSANTFQSAYPSNNRHDVEQELDPICEFVDSQMTQDEPSYIQSKNPGPSDDRLGRLEKMVEMLVQNNVNKTQTGSFNISQETSLTSLETVPKGIQQITSMWLNKVNEECLERQFDEITCINFMQSKMSGLMKAWFKTLDPYDYTWPELKMLITRTFPDIVDFASTLRLLVNRIKRPDETVTQYYFSKMYLIEACKISGPNAVSCLIDGLNEPHIQKEAKEQNFLTPEKLYAQFLTKLPNFGLGSQVVEQQPMLEVIRDHSIRERDRDEYHPRDDYKKRERVYDDSLKKCYTCGKQGHISENCRHAPICYKCRKKGHIAAKCPNL